MTKAELGTKRLCPNCGTKYYDLKREPIVCPRCGTVFEVTSVRARQPAASRPVKVVEVEEPVESPAEVVSLEEADEEAAEAGKVAVVADDDEEEAAEETQEDDTFLAEEGEEEEDVGAIIGEVDDEER